MSTIHVVQRWKIHSIILSAFPSVKSFCELIAGQFLVKYILPPPKKQNKKQQPRKSKLIHKTINHQNIVRGKRIQIFVLRVWVSWTKIGESSCFISSCHYFIDGQFDGTAVWFKGTSAEFTEDAGVIRCYQVLSDSYKQHNILFGAQNAGKH